MATYRTSAAGGGTSGSSDRTCTITPAVGDLFVVFCNASGNTNAAPTCSDDNGGTYTLITTALKNSSADILSVFVRTATLANTTSTVVTVATGSNTAAEIVVVALSGMVQVGSAAVLQSAVQANQASGTTPAPAFTNSALTGNVTLGAVANTTTPATMTAPTNWTERQDVGQSTPSTGLEVVSRDSGFTGTTVTWGSTSGSAFASVILEMDGGSRRTPTIGSLTAAGVAGALVLGTILTPLVGALALTPQTALSVQQYVRPAVGTLFLGIDPNASLTPATGALAATGLAPTPSLGTLQATAVGSLTLTGQTPTLDLGSGASRTPTVGSLTLTGGSSTLALALTPQVGSLLFGDPLGLTPYPASLALTGGDATAVANTFLTPAVGSLSATGLAGRMDLGLAASVGSVTLTEGNALTLAQIAPNPGVLSLLGQTAALVSGPRLTPATATLTFTGTNPPANLVSLPAAGTLTLTGSTPLFSVVRPSTGAMTLTAFQPGQPALQLQPGTGSLAFGLANELPTGTLAFTGYAPKIGSLIIPLTGTGFFGLSQDVILTPTTGTLALTGLQARPNPPDNTNITPITGVLRLYRVPQPPVASLGLTGAVPGVVHSLLRTPTAGSLTLTGQLPIENSPSCTPSVGSLTALGVQPTVADSGNASQTRLPTTGSLTLTGAAGFVSAGVVPVTGTGTLSGLLASVGMGIVPTTGTLAISGVTSGLPVGCTPGAGSLVLDGRLPEFLGRRQPATGSLALVGDTLLTGTHPIVPTSLLIEYADPEVALPTEEGTATTSGTAVEGVPIVTFTVSDYV